MDLVGTAVGNPLNEDDLKEDSDAVLAPDLLLVRVYGGKLMQLGPFMPPLLVFIALMNGYSRNDEFMPWLQEARCKKSGPRSVALLHSFDRSEKAI